MVSLVDRALHLNSDGLCSGRLVSRYASIHGGLMCSQMLNDLISALAVARQD